MKLDVDSERFLYTIGVVLAVAAFLYFVQDLVFGLSITVKAVLLFLTFVAFLAVATALERTPLHGVALALSSGAYLVGLGYVVLRYDVGEAGIFLGLVVSSALFIALGRLYDRRAPVLPWRTAGAVVLAVVLVSVALVAVDAAGGGVTYDLQTNESASVGPPADRDYPDERGYTSAEVRIGTVTATNEFVFRRLVALPELSGCVVGTDAPDDRYSYVSYDYSTDWPGAIGGGDSISVPVVADVPVSVNATEPVSFAVERRATCPDSADRPTVVVTTDGAFA